MPSDASDLNEQRRVLLAGAIGMTLATPLVRAAARAGQATSPVDAGSVRGTAIHFPPIQAETEAPIAPPPNPDPPPQRVRFAVMGLGRLALENIIPAFGQAKHARLTGLISGSSEKMASIGAQFGVSKDNCYGYNDWAKLKANREIDAVYVVLPNALHRDAVVQLAQAGKHVLCEKPMATSASEAHDMINACRTADRKLMIAYRCQYEVINRELARRARAGELGDIQLIEAVNTQNQGDPTQWRQVKALAGGGSLPDVGLYCLNTARALLGEEPVEVTALIHSPENDPRFREVESNVNFLLRFPSGIVANCASSYSLHQKRSFAVLGSNAHARIDNAFAYEGQKLFISQREGDAEAVREIALGVKNQFALELDHFATCIRENVVPRTPGEEGLQDQLVMAAIYESARTGRPVTLEAITRRDSFRGPEAAKST